VQVQDLWIEAADRKPFGLQLDAHWTYVTKVPRA
jgi:hypothetical protein